MKQESPIKRRQSRQIFVGDVAVGGDAPISVQTMTDVVSVKHDCVTALPHQNAFQPVGYGGFA